jgi:hypothetical protein
MKKIFYIVVFFILFHIIQRLPIIFGQESVGFPLTTFKLWFTTTRNDDLNSTTTKHLINEPNNIYINFVIYSGIVSLFYWYVVKKNVFEILLGKLLFNKIMSILKSRWLVKTFKIFKYSYIFFMFFITLQFLPYRDEFENDISSRIGFPKDVYYRHDIQCYVTTYYEPLNLIINYITILIFTILIYLIVKFIKKYTLKTI